MLNITRRKSILPTSSLKTKSRPTSRGINPSKSLVVRTLFSPSSPSGLTTSLFFRLRAELELLGPSSFRCNFNGANSSLTSLKLFAPKLLTPDNSSSAVLPTISPTVRIPFLSRLFSIRTENFSPNSDRN